MKEQDSLVAHTDEKKKGKNSPPLQVLDLHLQALYEGKSIPNPVRFCSQMQVKRITFATQATNAKKKNWKNQVPRKVEWFDFAERASKDKVQKNSKSQLTPATAK